MGELLPLWLYVIFSATMAEGYQCAPVFAFLSGGGYQF
jgi:hypothetical protein